VTPLLPQTWELISGWPIYHSELLDASTVDIPMRRRTSIDLNPTILAIYVAVVAAPDR
jgi:hypothetical protein